MFTTNPFKNPGTLSVLGTPIDLSRITCDAFILAGLTDHIVPWKACYATTQMLGGQREFVLSGSGHVQSIVTPPGSGKARYFTGRGHPASADDWLAGADGAPTADVVIAGDVCYEQAMSARALAWLRGHARLGRLVLLGDPGRNYFSAEGLKERARYDIPTSLQLENRGMRETVVWQVLPHP